MAYHLQLPAKAKIHSVFHCSMLKPFRGSPEDTKIATLPGKFINDQPMISPLAILDYRKTSSTPQASWQVLVQWQGLTPDETSWEEWSQLCQDYHLEDKVISQGPQGDKETEAEHTRIGVVARVQREGKPKRAISKPSYLKDYV